MTVSIIYAMLALGGMGLLLGVGLGIAAIKFKVETDPRLPLVRDALPGANCGGCGFAGCDAFADAIIKGEAKPNGCPVGGNESARKIGEVMGISVEEQARKCAFIRCAGCESKSNFRYDYKGMTSCPSLMQLAGGGSKACVYGCLGGGTCLLQCKFGAISMVDGIAVIDNEKCTACGMCAAACPKSLIQLVPHDSKTRVACHSNDAGKATRVNCKVGCIGCKLCEKNCKFDAVHVKDFLATIDYEKCTQCGACAAKCPSKCIISV
ncbi:MAG: RnfABCDGE type electron transport complex subunit B [Peptococcaceae bacterium]|nr:RnfABCDGE type electron transport complex subunit B [Peptococcaceae bacterium]